MTADLYQRLKDADPVPHLETYDQASTAAILARALGRGAADPSTAGDQAPPIELGRTRRDHARDLAAIMVVLLVFGGIILWLSRLSPQTITAALPEGYPPTTTASSAGTGPPTTSTEIPAVPRSVQAAVAAGGDKMTILDTPVDPQVAATLLERTRPQFSSLTEPAPVLGVSYARMTLPNYGHIKADGTVDPFVADRIVLVVWLHDVPVPLLGPGPNPGPNSGTSRGPDDNSSRGDVLALYDRHSHEFIYAFTY